MKLHNTSMYVGGILYVAVQYLLYKGHWPMERIIMGTMFIGCILVGKGIAGYFSLWVERHAREDADPKMLAFFPYVAEYALWVPVWLFIIKRFGMDLFLYIWSGVGVILSITVVAIGILATEEICKNYDNMKRGKK